MGARGEYDDYKKFNEENGIDSDTAHDIQSLTHVTSGAFMRMWITQPVLTESLMLSCLDDRSRGSRSIYEEIYVAYSVMSKLVDKKDAYVVRPDGEIDSWVLCR